MYVFDIVPDKIKVPVLSPSGEIENNKDGSIKMIEKESSYTGKVVVRAPKHQERLRYSKEIHVTKEQGNKFDIDPSDGLEKTIRMIDIAKKHIVEVELKRKDNGFEIKDVETLEVDGDSAFIFSQVAIEVIKGVTLGNGLRRQ